MTLVARVYSYRKISHPTKRLDLTYGQAYVFRIPKNVSQLVILSVGLEGSFFGTPYSCLQLRQCEAYSLVDHVNWESMQNL